MKQTKFKDTEIGKIPQEWEDLIFDDFIKIQNGFAFKSSEFKTKGVPIIKIKNITPPVITFEEVQYYAGVVDAKLKPYILKRGDIVISMTGSNVNQMASAVGKVARYKSDSPVLLNQRAGKLLIDGNIADMDYIYFYIARREIQYYLAINAAGSANQANISPDIIKSIPIALPPLQEQSTIAKILSSLDEKIELNQEMNKTLEAVGQALFKYWFVDFEFPDDRGRPYKSSGGKMEGSELGDIPRGWEVKPIDEVADFLNGLALQKFPAESEEEFLPVIKIRELKQGVTESSDRASKNIPKEYIVHDGDVLFSWSGSLEVIIWSYGKGALNQHLFKVTSKEYPKWFYYYWVLQHLPEYRHIAEGKATTMGHIQRGHLKSSLVLVPDEETLSIMDKMLSPIINKQIATNVEARNLSSIRDSLLPRLMSGRIRVNVG